MGGSTTRDLTAHESSVVNMYDGWIGDDLEAKDSSFVNFYGGSVGDDLEAKHNSILNFYGGSVGDKIKIKNSGILNFYGGSVGDDLEAKGNSSINIYGVGFAVDGIPVGYGPISAFSGTLTGTLYMGNSLSNAFSRYCGATIYLHEQAVVPLPGAVLLGVIGLGAAGWKLRKFARRAVLSERRCVVVTELWAQLLLSNQTGLAGWC
jgi:hypothetical protein